jgi:hypothetical protein
MFFNGTVFALWSTLSSGNVFAATLLVSGPFEASFNMVTLSCSDFEPEWQLVLIKIAVIRNKAGLLKCLVINFVFPVEYFRLSRGFISEVAVYTHFEGQWFKMFLKSAPKAVFSRMV